MKLEFDQHMHAEAVLRVDFKEEIDEILGALRRVRVPLRSPVRYLPKGRGGPLKRQEKKLSGRKAHLLLPINQGDLNRAIKKELRARGWKSEPFVDDLRADRKLSSSIKGDFAKNGVFVEVEFGNTASMFRDLFKFHMAGRTGDAEVGVLVVAKQRMAWFFDSGVATFEAAQRLLPYLHIGVQIPVLVIGVEPDNWPDIEATYERMRAFCEEKGETCHSFAIAQKHAGTEEDSAAEADS